MSAEDKGKNRQSSSNLAAYSLLHTPPHPRPNRARQQNIMDELLDETFNSDSIEDSHSLVGLDDSASDPDSSPGTKPVLAGPTSPEAKASDKTTSR